MRLTDKQIELVHQALANYEGALQTRMTRNGEYGHTDLVIKDRSVFDEIREVRTLFDNELQYMRDQARLKELAAERAEIERRIIARDVPPGRPKESRDMRGI